MGRRLRRSFAIDHGDLISRPSYAPIAAVWLIIAMLFIASYRTPTHAVVIDLPTNSDGLQLSDFAALTQNTVGLTIHGQLTWNRTPVSHREILDRLHRLRESPEPQQIIFEPNGNASYRLAAQVLSVLNAEHSKGGFHFCFGGLAQHAKYETSAQMRAPFPSYISVLIDKNHTMEEPDHGIVLANCEPAPANIANDQVD